LTDITRRTWVRAHAQDYILEYFRLITERRKAAHAAHLERITQYSYQYYYAPPHPNEIAQAQATLKRGIDEDWQASVQRYPEVLEYFYQLVQLTLPDDSDSAVKDPPLSALSGSRKAGRRSSTAAPTMVGDSAFHRNAPLPSRTPPPIIMDRRTPGPSLAGGPPPPPSSRRVYRAQPPPASFYGPPF
jgi:hypothetical protein